MRTTARAVPVSKIANGEEQPQRRHSHGNRKPPKQDPGARGRRAEAGRGQFLPDHRRLQQFAVACGMPQLVKHLRMLERGIHQLFVLLRRQLAELIGVKQRFHLGIANGHWLIGLPIDQLLQIAPAPGFPDEQRGRCRLQALGNRGGWHLEKTLA